MKNILIIVIILIVGAGVGFFFFSSQRGSVQNLQEDVVEQARVGENPQSAQGGVVDSAAVEKTSEPVVSTETEENMQEAVSDTEKEQTSNENPVSIGKSVEGRDILAYTYGTGYRELLIVGGIHGGYSFNTALLAYEMINWFTEEPSVIPEGVKITVIPELNPDGLFLATNVEDVFSASDVTTSNETLVASRFNANDVDLNRNFDCHWNTEATWQQRTVSGGTAAFSEPETRALRAYIESYTPDAVIAYYSAAGGVYAAGCDTSTDDSLVLTDLYAEASGYPAYMSFDAYATTGDMTNWLAKEGIAVTSVLLTDRTHTEFAKNKAGIQAVIESIQN